MLNDIFPYLLFILSLSILVILPLPQRKGFLLMAVIIFLFSALRYNVGWDFEHYYEIIKYPFGHQFERLEFFPRMLIQLSNKLEFPQFFFISTSFIATFLVYKGVKIRSFLPKLSIFAYVCLPLFFFQSLTIIRQLIAVTLVFYATVYYLERGKYIKFLMIVFFSCFFHISAFLSIIFLLVKNVNFSNKSQFWLLFISFVLPHLVIPIIANIPTLPFGITALINTYIMENEFPGFGLMIYLLFAMAILNLVYFDRLIFVNRHNELYIKLFTMGIVIYNTLLPFGIAGARASIFFLIFSIVIIPSYVFLFERKSNRIILQNFIVFLLAMIFFSNIYVSTSAYTKGLTTKDSLLPYNFYFN